MKTLNLTAAGKQVAVLVPDSLASGQEELQALWLIAPKGEDAGIWLEKTKAGEYAETAKALLVCAPGEKEDSFYTQALWTVLHEQFPALSDAPGGHRLLGLNDSAERCLKFVFHYPERFCIAVAVCPTSGDNYRELLTFVKDYMETGKPRPRTVISDCAGGQGKNMGEAINEHGVGLHIHAERPAGGWELMDAEIKSCLAHL